MEKKSKEADGGEALAEAKRIMERLVKSPPKPHTPVGAPKEKGKHRGGKRSDRLVEE